MSGSNEVFEKALWEASSALREKAARARKMADLMRRQRNHASCRHHEQVAQEAAEQAEVIFWFFTLEQERNHPTSSD